MWRTASLVVALLGGVVGMGVGRPMLDAFQKKYPRYWGLLPLFVKRDDSTFTAESLPSLHGKTALITGANIGVGLSTAKHLGRKGMRIILACRNPAKCQAAIESLIKDGVPKEHLVAADLDLSSLESTAAFANGVLAREGRLDALVLNAGVGPLPFQLTSDGIEAVFHTNHMGNFLLCKSLTPLLKKTSEKHGESRVVVLSSSAHYNARGVPLTEEEMNGGHKDTASHLASCYMVSKLANLLFAQELSDRLAGTRVIVNAAHPGLVASNFATHTVDQTADLLAAVPVVGRALAPAARAALGAFRAGVFAMGWSPDDGALTPAYLAASPEVSEGGVRGKFFVPIAQRNDRTSPQARDAGLQRAFWEFSERVLAQRGY